MFAMGWVRRWKRRKIIRQILREVERNLEAYHVMRQLDQCRQFKLSVRGQGIPGEDLPWPSDVQNYMERLGEYNQAVEDAQAYERWYRLSTENQSQETARRLHALQERVEEKLPGLQSVILTARKVIQKELSERSKEKRI